MEIVRAKAPSRRPVEVVRWWRQHISAWARSGQSQAAYCRAQGLGAQHFSYWKVRLRRSDQATELPAAKAASERPQLVPVIINERTGPRSRPAVPVADSGALAVTVTLPNGIALSLQVSLPELAPVLTCLHTLSC